MKNMVTLTAAILLNACASSHIIVGQTFDDLQHYQRVIAALAKTITLQAEIDAAIPSWPIA